MQFDEVPSGFPVLPEHPDHLPDIPGGWNQVEITLGGRPIQLFRPKDPDLFLDDAEVQRENAKNDYMPYWAFLWPSAIPMAEAVLNAPWPVGTPVLELGAGVGLVGLAAAVRGDCVTFSDYDQTALHLCRVNARLNGVPEVDLWHLDWRNITPRQFPVLIGCEVTYDAALHEPLLDTIAALLAPDGVCWLGDPGRYQSQFFQQKVTERGFRLRRLDRHGQDAEAVSPGELQILEIRLATS